MADKENVITVEQFAKEIAKEKKVSVAKFIEQLNNSGVKVKEASDTITDADKKKFFKFFGEGEVDESKQRKTIRLNRSTKETLKMPSGGKGAKKTTTVTITRKRTKVYVSKTPEAIAAEIAEKERLEQEKIEQERAAAEQKALEDTKKAKQEEERLAKEAEQKALLEAEKAAKEKSTAKSKPEPKVKDVEDSKKDSKDKSAIKPKKDKVVSKDSDKEKQQKDQKRKTKLKPASEEKRKFRPIITDDFEEIEEEGSRSARRGGKGKYKNKDLDEIASRHAFAKPTEPVIREIFVPEFITVADIAKQLSVKAGEVIKSLMKMGVMANINQALDQDTACLIIEELGHKATAYTPKTAEESISIEYDAPEETRSPVVTIMGHVDHGKTSLLDYIRESRVTEKESGGITQHIGAYTVDTDHGKIAFLDTPGHSAFTAMRSRGAKCTDIVVLVVAADDGVMPQTVEAIQHAKAAKVPIIVAINKMDKPEADPEKVTTELSSHELIPEAWGGDTQFIKISAKEGTGVDELLTAISLQSEVLELKAPVSGPAKGVVIESRLDKGRGTVASLLIQTGSLKQGDMVLAGIEVGRVRSMLNDMGQQIKIAGPSTPVEILGLSGIPNAGDEFIVVESEKRAKEVAVDRQIKNKEMKLARQQASKLEGFMDKMKQSNEDVKDLNIILKADVIGSLEALKEALLELSNEEVKVRIIAEGIGGFNESDINLAIASGAVLIGFNVRADATARKLAQNEDIKLNYFSIIYDVVDCIKSAVEGKVAPKYEERIVGTAEVREVFKSSKIGSIAGCIVIEGIVKRGNPIRVLRDNVVIYEGELESLRRFKDDAQEVRKGMECGIGVKNYNDIKAKDQIEVFEKVLVKK